MEDSGDEENRTLPAHGDADSQLPSTELVIGTYPITALPSNFTADAPKGTRTKPRKPKGQTAPCPAWMQRTCSPPTRPRTTRPAQGQGHCALCHRKCPEQGHQVTRLWGWRCKKQNIQNVTVISFGQKLESVRGRESGMAVHTHYPRTQEAEARQLPELHSESPPPTTTTTNNLDLRLMPLIPAVGVVVVFEAGRSL